MGGTETSHNRQLRMEGTRGALLNLRTREKRKVRQELRKDKLDLFYLPEDIKIDICLRENGHEMRQVFFLFKSCIRLFKGTKNSHAAVSYGVNKTRKTNN